MIGIWAGSVFLIGMACGVWIGRALQARQPLGSSVTVRRDDIERLSLNLNLQRWAHVAERAGNLDCAARIEAASKRGFTWTHRTLVIGDGGVE